MPLRFRFKLSFNKEFEALSSERQDLVTKALEALDEYFKTGKASYGLRVKKLYESSTGKTYEARISLDLRIVWIQSRDQIVFSLIGNHNDICRFIKNL